MKINYRYVEETKELIFEWSDSVDKSKKIMLTTEEEVNLDDVYDFIICNIENIQLEDLTDTENMSESFAHKASKEIIQAINTEISEIREIFLEINSSSNLTPENSDSD